MKPGDFVWYKHQAPNLGRVKRIGHSFVWVVFCCGGDWEHYLDYDAAGVVARDLELLEPNDERVSTLDPHKK
jgi:hypothetical protein